MLPLKPSPFTHIKKLSQLFFVLILGLGGCGNPLGEEIICDKFDDGLKITQWPQSARIRQENCYSGFNPTYQAEFTITPQDLPVLNQQVPFQKIKQWRQETTSQIFSDSRLQQKGTQMNSLLYADFSDGTTLMEVLIDTSNPKMYVVYVSHSYVD
ncbi:hypothetical protein [Acaryochloris sp. IP29b_bin.137]|uniref:hypothetical protein n=1 Tax=Acaryochloris sp. IP29b_bin.137 TaxID=2969217 RepID=UPI00261BF518|nr:hypothetical protein [Acaryochloris sp. IP29b_bin.137]